MKTIFFSLLILLLVSTISAEANNNCYLKLIQVQDDIYFLSNSQNNNIRQLENYNKKTHEALDYSALLGRSNTIPNDYLMTMIDSTNMIFNSLKQNSLSTTSQMQIVNFPKLKKEFNDCITENVKTMCPNAIEIFNTKIDSLITNQNEVSHHFNILERANSLFYSTLKNDYETKTMMTADKLKNLYSSLEPSYYNYKIFLNASQEDTLNIYKVIENDLTSCLNK